ncbi:exocyst complex component EXO70E2 [Dendrobium catenatum]|uniref:exocyst complex component EXO70E2 n=1 Tax=Dendrobium catenatum TaxID=906689 RepID=UPI0009F711AE|nr:exocyst complex component EXO70E2 [Dendrobium catenatum]XP_020678509.1 exocyst complex component EXO70E2 [Dendrobium catenatum]XP_020678510.1 exocyst complex component EXO70E2 [Dendrobium catenatum]XP_020678511.1 exocyst complex component EXO70E2 [Dendrobium catenatum]
MADCASVVGVEVSKQKLLTEEGEMSESEARLGILHEKIVNWNSDQSMIWDRDPDETSEFLQVVNEVQQLVDKLTTSPVYNKLLCYADSTLQMAMARLEEEFVHLLRQYRQPLEPDHMSFRSMEEELSEDFSSSSFEEEAIQGKSHHDSGRRSEDFLVDLIHPDVVCDLRCIAETMFSAKYDRECCQAYISVRMDALDECLSVLRIEKLSIEEVLQLEWSSLNSMIKRWNRALKVFVRVYLSSENRLCDLIFGELSVSLRQSCFVEISKSSIMQFLNLGEAIAVGPLKPEKLFRILDMYEVLADLLTDIESLFPNESGSFIVNECNDILSRLGEYVRGTFSAFKNAILRNTSTTGFAGGGVHPLTKYVMNYIKALADYRVTMNVLFDEQNYSLQEEGNGLTPVASNLQSVTSILESNLNDRSMLYVDTALQCLFLMNNICYMVQKVKDSDLQPILGDDWIRLHIRKFTQHAMNYERASWNPVLLFLKDEGIHNHGSSTPSKTVLKDRFKNFNQAFEEVYRTQMVWSVPNVGLREDLRISISLKVLQAYRTFIGRYASHLDGVRNREHYIKYCPEDLESALLDLFEGTPKVMHPRRR